MPPLKRYIFENIDNSDITIAISTYNLMNAFVILGMITKNPDDFKCMNN
jgi:hypothetical protein